ncbi:MAG: hypothetical protein GY859_41080 [Desulfobacterales bacterium]|nr:hypothetical protein [Desulfobacterales bacterium]
MAKAVAKADSSLHRPRTSGHPDAPWLAKAVISATDHENQFRMAPRASSISGPYSGVFRQRTTGASFAWLRVQVQFQTPTLYRLTERHILDILIIDNITGFMTEPDSKFLKPLKSADETDRHRFRPLKAAPRSGSRNQGRPGEIPSKHCPLGRESVRTVQIPEMFGPSPVIFLIFSKSWWARRLTVAISKIRGFIFQ